MKRVKFPAPVFLFLGVVLMYSCSSHSREKQPYRIVYVNSYHEGYGSSDEVMAGIGEALHKENVELKTLFLDAKRKTEEQEMDENIQNVLLELNAFKPDLLIVSDDNAVKELVVPYFNHTQLPVVFCGVNWSAGQYHLGTNVTGMLEVLPLRECLREVISNYPGTKRLVVLSENSLSEQNNRTLLDTLYRNLGLEVTYRLADDFESWKTFFLEAGQNADLIYLPTNGAIKNWNQSEAILFVEENLKVPVVTCDDFMMPYAVFGLTKVAREQGEWAAKTAMEILKGKSPAEIPYARNLKSKAWLNMKLADKIEYKISGDMKTRCTQR